MSIYLSIHPHPSIYLPVNLDLQVETDTFFSCTCIYLHRYIYTHRFGLAPSGIKMSTVKLMTVEDMILTAFQLRACYAGFKADLKARHECHGFSRWYKSSLHFGADLANFPIQVCDTFCFLGLICHLVFNQVFSPKGYVSSAWPEETSNPPTA